MTARIAGLDQTGSGSGSGRGVGSAGSGSGNGSGGGAGMGGSVGGKGSGGSGLGSVISLLHMLRNACAAPVAGDEPKRRRRVAIPYRHPRHSCDLGRARSDRSSSERRLPRTEPSGVRQRERRGPVRRLADPASGARNGAPARTGGDGCCPAASSTRVQRMALGRSSTQEDALDLHGVDVAVPTLWGELSARGKTCSSRKRSGTAAALPTRRAAL